MRFGGARRAHFEKPHPDAADGELPCGFASGKSCADNADEVSSHPKRLMRPSRFAVFTPRRACTTRRNVRAVKEIGRAHVELQSRRDLVCRLLLEKKKKKKKK